MARSRRSHPFVVRWGIPPMIAIVAGGCSSGSAGSLDDADDVADRLAEQGQVVDDTTIDFDAATGVLSVGGIEMAGVFDGLEFSPDNINQLIPSRWPTMALSISNVTEQPRMLSEVGVAVLAQTTLATDVETRSQFIEQGFSAIGMEDAEFVGSDSITGEVDGNERTCWWEVRNRLLDHVIMVFAGEGVASSVMSIAMTDDGPDGQMIAADLSEAACGVRPEGT